MEKVNAQENVKLESTYTFTCPSCGGNMTFDPESQSLQCPYCGNKADIQKVNGGINEHDFVTTEESYNQDWGEEVRVIRCESCGAETVLKADGTADFCAFCGSSHIVKFEKSPGITPESLIPFKVSQKAALGRFSTWISKRFFSPNALKSNYQNQKMSGVYIPYWTYDTNTNSNYTAEAGTYYYETVTEWVEENGQKRMVTKQVRKIRWNWTSGSFSHFFDDVLINASKHAAEGIIKKLEPFKLGELIKYTPQYLSGFLAERYSINIKDGWENARNIIDGDIRSGIISQINADEVRNLNISTNYTNVKFKHILLPVWISAYGYKNKTYRYMINGQTGEVQGEAPLSPIKVGLAVLAGIILLIGIFYLMSHS